jgi:hypothetical protein
MSHLLKLRLIYQQHRGLLCSDWKSKSIGGIQIKLRMVILSGLRTMVRVLSGWMKVMGHYSLNQMIDSKRHAEACNYPQVK